ncbi:superoxide dismutase family protein [Bartonella choladocola]|uniref:Superoxide dismutase, Cu-Zn family n=1 Tax=Bartonella choladocola TaxID=2750995 RepID=A0A1U9MIF4_9HYPH|nr:superoxide dismutase family protein [Bartonella choladocola]AQT47684.1 superoxide dismutase, Cu-Zn family [Bartonella choladocola]
MKRCVPVLALSLPLTAFALSTAAFAASSAKASLQSPQSLTVDIYRATENGLGHQMGEVTITESAYGLVFTPKLKELRPGLYAFHVHVNPECGLASKNGKVDIAGLAGGHLDPQNTNRHSAPWDDNGHLGDLPPLYVDEKGNATLPVLAPKLKKLDDVRGHSLMIHSGQDNYSDAPDQMESMGARYGCGVIR